MSEIKLAEPVRKLLKEKEDEIKELTEKVKSLESKTEELKSLKSELEKLKEGLAKERKAGKKAEAPLEDLVFAYILGAGGEINVPRCAEDLGAKEEQVKDAIDKLVESGRISR